MGKINAGTEVESAVVFRNTRGVAYDPPMVVCRWVDPAGTLTEHTYLTDPEVVRDGAGQYHMNQLLDLPGRWGNQWEGVGQIVDNVYVVAVAGNFTPLVVTP